MKHFNASFKKLMIVVVFFLSAAQPAHRSFAAGARLSNYVMNHLTMVDLDTLRNQMQALKNIGVDAITLDMSWSVIEPQMDHFNWAPYKMFFDAAKEVGIGVLPIFSFHRIGSNVGDNTTKPVPNWVWSLTQDMKFVDSNGYASDELPAYGIPEVYARFAKVMQSFADNFRDYSAMIPGMYVVPGIAGELRYPSYQPLAGWSYPQPGLIQAYSERSKNAFRSYLQQKYSTIAAVNTTWGTQYGSFSDIQPPGNPDDFFTNGWKTSYGNDFMTWYQKVLEDHADKMFTLAEGIFKNPSHPFFSGSLLGKIGGIHWLDGDPQRPHAAEKAAGYNDYDGLISVFAKHHAGLTFTCLEMLDNDVNPVYSQPQELTSLIAALAQKYSVSLSGENALSVGTNESAFQQIRNVLVKDNFSAFTMLRIDDLVNADGTLTAEGNLYKEYMTNVTRANTVLLRRQLFNLLNCKNLLF